MKVKVKNILFFLSLIIYIFIVFGGQVFFTSTGADDAKAISTIDAEVNLGDSYAVMAFIYKMIPEQFISISVITIGSIFIYAVYHNAKNKESALLLFFLLIIPIVFTIATFQKDLILTLFIVPIFFLIQLNKPLLFKVILICLIYFSYAVVFRNYYYLIIIFFIFILYFKKSNIFIRIMSIFILMLAIFILPDSVYYKLQSARDIVNEFRIGVQAEGNRTAFNNPLPPNSFLNFLFNYLYAIIRLNFGFFFTFGIKDMIFVVYPLIYYYYTFKGLYEDNEVNFLAGALILAHALVYFLFEPDTGSYARHLASTLPYLAIIIASKINYKLKI